MQDLTSTLKRLIERLQSAYKEALTVRTPIEIELGHLSVQDGALLESEDRINSIVEAVQRVEEELQEVLEETLGRKGKTLH